MSPIGWHLTSEVFVKIFQLSGLWFPAKTSYLYSFYAFVIYILCVLSYAVFAVVYMCSVKSIEKATQALFMLTIVSQLFTKATFFLFFNRRIQNLLHQLHSEFDLNNDVERNLVNKRLRFCFYLLIPYLILCATCASLGTVSSAFKTKPQLPFPTWHPLDWTNDKVSYWLAWSQISCATYVAIANTAVVQMFSCYLMVFVSVLMEVLGQRLSNLWSTASGSSKLNDSTDLNECIQMHHKIL